MAPGQTDCDKAIPRSNQESQPLAGMPPVSRRALIGRLAKRTAFIAPIFATLCAQPAFASGVGSCGSIGEACTANDDCCGCCDLTGMNPTNLCLGETGCKQDGEACILDSECCGGECDMMGDCKGC